MKIKLTTFVPLIAGLLLVCTSALAHHGNTAFDLNHQVVLKNAKVTSVLWANPHIVLYFDVADQNGKIVHWVAEGGSPEAVLRQGWRSGTLQEGDVITARVLQAKDGRPIGQVVDFTLPNGKTIVAWPEAAHRPFGEGVDCSKPSVSGGSVSLACIGKGAPPPNDKPNDK